MSGLDETDVYNFQGSGLIKPSRKLNKTDYVKFSLVGDSILIVVLGCCTLAFGLWIIFNALFQYDVVSFSYVGSVGYALIALSVCVVVTAAAGCCSMIKINKPIAACYLTSLMVEFFLLLTIGCWSVIQAITMKDVVLITLKSAISSYFHKTSSSEFMNLIQSQFKCCGADQGFSDYAIQNSNRSYVPSPSSPPVPNMHLFSDICEWKKFGTACVEPVTDYIYWPFIVLSTFIISLLVSMLVALVLTLLACCGATKEEDE